MVRPDRRARSIAAWLFGSLAALGCSLASAAGGWLGQPLSQALTGLNGGDFSIIFSSELVPDRLLVTVEPSAGDAEHIAVQILAPFGLGLRQIAPGVFAVVLAGRAPGTIAAPPTPRTPAALAPSLEQIVVVASRYSLGEVDSGATRIDSGLLANQPQFANDAMRAVARLPGIASNGLTARINVRGGGADELLLLMDGFPIRQAYHVPAFFSPFSTLDSSTIAALDVYTGGFPLRYGARMSGVVDFSTIDPDREPRHSLNMGWLDAGARTAGTLSTAAGLDALISMRSGILRSKLDRLALDALTPFYADGFAKLRWRPSDESTLTAQALWSRDAVAVRDPDRGEFARLSSRTRYLWLHGAQRLSTRWRAEAWLGYSALHSERYGTVDNVAIAVGSVADTRSADLWDLRWRFKGALSERQHIELGGEWQVGDSDYQYRSALTLTPEIAALYQRAEVQNRDSILAPFRRDVGLYGAYRLRMGARTTVELGTRVLRAAGLDLNSTVLWDPRIMLSQELGVNTRLRVSWGRFHQTDEVQELSVEDGALGFAAPQESVHTIIGLEHVDRRGIDWRMEVFRKTQAAPRLRYENQLNPLAILPELAPDRQLINAAEADLSGAEFSATYRGATWNWRLGYTWSDARDELNGHNEVRSWNQPHAFNGSVEWTRRRWSAAAALSLHSGWPTTRLQRDAAGQLVVGPRNDAHWPTYASLDLRVGYRRPMGLGELVVSADVANALDRANRCCSELSTTRSAAVTGVALEPLALMPLTPTLNIRWNF